MQKIVALLLLLEIPITYLKMKIMVGNILPQGTTGFVIMYLISITTGALFAGLIYLLELSKFDFLNRLTIKRFAYITGGLLLAYFFTLIVIKWEGYEATRLVMSSIDSKVVITNPQLIKTAVDIMR